MGSIGRPGDPRPRPSRSWGGGRGAGTSLPEGAPLTQRGKHARTFCGFTACSPVSSLERASLASCEFGACESGRASLARASLVRASLVRASLARASSDACEFGACEFCRVRVRWAPCWVGGGRGECFCTVFGLGSWQSWSSEGRCCASGGRACEFSLGAMFVRVQLPQLNSHALSSHALHSHAAALARA